MLSDFVKILAPFLSLPEWCNDFRYCPVFMGCDGDFFEMKFVK